MKKLKLIIPLAVVLLAVLWFWRYNITMSEAVAIPDVHFEKGEAVPFGDNYYWTSQENPGGYTIEINDSKLFDAKEYLSLWGGENEPFARDIEKLHYVYDLEVTVKNESNTDGSIQFANFIMIDKATIIRIELDLLSLCEPTLKDVGSFKLPIGKERTFHFPFVADPNLVEADSGRLRAVMESGNFALCISQIPERRLIKIK